MQEPKLLIVKQFMTIYLKSLKELKLLNQIFIKKRTQGELGLKGYIRDTLKNEEGFTRSTRAFSPEAIEKRAASIKALGKGKAPTEYQLAKKAFLKI